MPPSHRPAPPTTPLCPDTCSSILYRKTRLEGTWRTVLGAGTGGGGFQLPWSPGKGVAVMSDTTCRLGWCLALGLWCWLVASLPDGGSWQHTGLSSPQSTSYQGPFLQAAAPGPGARAATDRRKGGRFLTVQRGDLQVATRSQRVWAFHGL